MANVSRRIVVLVDPTKFRAPSLHRFCSIDRIDTIVTDWNVSKHVEEAFRKRGVTLIIASQPIKDRMNDLEKTSNH